jgi:membrane protein YqaA with SNARE-associated domain
MDEHFSDEHCAAKCQPRALLPRHLPPPGRVRAVRAGRPRQLARPHLRRPWYEYAAVATIGSTIGAYITFRLARKAGEAYLEHKFGTQRVAGYLGIFKKWGTGTLIASSAIPFPFPTSLVFAAACASDYQLSKYVAIVAISRGVRYTAIAMVADLFGRRFARMFQHPAQYWGWFLLFTAAVVVLIGAGILINKRLMATAAR